MTTTPCPICEADAEALPIPDFDSEAFHCPAHGRFEVSRTAMTTHRQKGILDWEGALDRAQARSRDRQSAPHRGRRFCLSSLTERLQAASNSSLTAHVVKCARPAGHPFIIPSTDQSITGGPPVTILDTDLRHSGAANGSRT